MLVFFDGKLVVVISFRVLFDFSDSYWVFEKEGLDVFQDYQIVYEDDVLLLGDVFFLVIKLLVINELEEGVGWVEVILLLCNSFDIGLCVFNFIEYYGLLIIWVVFVGGESLYCYVFVFGVYLFLFIDFEDVCQVFDVGYVVVIIFFGVGL